VKIVDIFRPVPFTIIISIVNFELLIKFIF